MPTGCLRARQRTDKARPSQHSSVREPAPPCDKFGAEVASAQWGRQRCQSSRRKIRKDRPWSAVIGRVIRHTFAFAICNELINNKRNSITKFDINLEKKYLYVYYAVLAVAFTGARLFYGSVLYFPFSEAIPRSSGSQDEGLRECPVDPRDVPGLGVPFGGHPRRSVASAAQPRRYHLSRRPERSRLLAVIRSPGAV